jgi:hypothetical protein
MKTYIALLAGVVALSASVSFADFSRSNFLPHPGKAVLGCKTETTLIRDAYTGKMVACALVDVDHRIPLKELYNSGLSQKQINKILKDPKMYVLTHRSVNRAKGALDTKGFERILKSRGEFDGRIYNANLRNVIALKQKYGLKLTPFEEAAAFRLNKVKRYKTIRKFIPGISKKRAIELAGKKFGKKAVKKVLLKGVGKFVPFAGWGLAVIDGVIFVANPESSTSYQIYKFINEQTKGRTVTERVENAVPQEDYTEVNYQPVQMNKNEMKALAKDIRENAKTMPRKSQERIDEMNLANSIEWEIALKKFEI